MINIIFFPPRLIFVICKIYIPVLISDRQGLGAGSSRLNFFAGTGALKIRLAQAPEKIPLLLTHEFSIFYCIFSKFLN